MAPASLSALLAKVCLPTLRFGFFGFVDEDLIDVLFSGVDRFNGVRFNDTLAFGLTMFSTYFGPISG